MKRATQQTLVTLTVVLVLARWLRGRNLRVGERRATGGPASLLLRRFAVRLRKKA